MGVFCQRAQGQRQHLFLAVEPHNLNFSPRFLDKRGFEGGVVVSTPNFT